MLTIDPSQDVPSTTSTVFLAPFQSDSFGRCSDAAASCEEKDQQHLLREGLSKLSAAQRTVLPLAYFGGLSIHEIAQVLGICEGTVKSRMANARRLLRHYLEHVGIQ